MARGWESKSVESQIEFANTSREQKARANADNVRVRERESLELSRKRVLNDLNSANNPRYRDVLMKGLAHLESRLAELA